MRTYKDSDFIAGEADLVRRYACHLEVSLSGCDSLSSCYDKYQPISFSVTKTSMLQQQAELVISIPHSFSVAQLISASCSLKYTLSNEGKKLIYSQKWMVSQVEYSSIDISTASSGGDYAAAVKLTLQSPAKNLSFVTNHRYWYGSRLADILSDVADYNNNEFDPQLIGLNKKINFIYQQQNSYSLLLDLLQQHQLYTIFYDPRLQTEPSTPPQTYNEKHSKGAGLAKNRLFITDNFSEFINRRQLLSPLSELVMPDLSSRRKLFDKDWRWQQDSPRIDYLKNIFLLSEPYVRWVNDCLEVSLQQDNAFLEENNFSLHPLGYSAKPSKQCLSFSSDYYTKSSSQIHLNDHCLKDERLPPKQDALFLNMQKDIEVSPGSFAIENCHANNILDNANYFDISHEVIARVSHVEDTMRCKLQLPQGAAIAGAKQGHAVATHTTATTFNWSEQNYTSGAEVDALVLAQQKHGNAEFTQRLSVGTYVYAVYDSQMDINSEDDFAADNIKNENNNSAAINISRDASPSPTKGAWLILGALPVYACAYLSKLSVFSHQQSSLSNATKTQASVMGVITQQLISYDSSASYVPQKIYSYYNLIDNQGSRFLMRDIAKPNPDMNNNTSIAADNTPWPLNVGAGISYNFSNTDGFSLLSENNYSKLKSNIQLSTSDEFICDSAKEIKYSAGKDYKINIDGANYIRSEQLCDFISQGDLNLLSDGSQNYRSGTIEMKAENYNMSVQNDFLTAADNISFTVDAGGSISLKSAESYISCDQLNCGGSSTQHIQISVPGASISISQSGIELQAPLVQLMAASASLPGLPPNS